MSHSTRNFRIFVSSTFNDMAAERNALQERVFPRLRKLCFKHGARFQPIDLRWGISQDAGLNQRAVGLCLKEIRRCQQVTKRPNFLLLLGDRYGWCPLPDDIPADEFEALIELISPTDQVHVKEWYWRDDNAVPAAYVLQPRRGEYVDKTYWNAVEAHLRQILLNALNRLDWPYEKRLKYEASVTEREIAAGIFEYPNAQHSAFCFIRTLDGPANSSSKYVDGDEQAKHQLESLKSRLHEYIPDNIYSYNVPLTGNEIALESLDQWCEDIYSVLAEAILSETANFEIISALETEREAQEKFMVDHTRHFVGRIDALQAIQKYIEGGPPTSLVVYGRSGVGKSTAIARAIQQAKSSHPQAEILYRFIGVTPDSANIRGLLVDLCKDIAYRYGNHDSIPQNYDDIIEALPKYLELATLERPLIVFLDALDQLQNFNTPSNLRWLPSQLPKQVKLILSCIPGDYLDSLSQRLPDNSFFEIEPLQRIYAEELLDDWLHETGRRLEPAQRTEVLNKFSHSGLPLYLRLAFEEARLWHSYTIETTLQLNVLSLLRDSLFARLAEEAEHGEMLVSRSMAYLAASRNGLTEDEILEILAKDSEYWSAFLKNAFHAPPGRQLPIAVWSRLYFDLEPYLIDRAVDGNLLLAFYHRQFSEAIDGLYLNSDRASRHAHLASHFVDQPLFIDSVPNSRKLDEQAYQQAKANMHDAYATTLTDYSFLEASLNLRGVQALIDECGLLDDETVCLISSALSMSAHVLTVDKQQLGSQIAGRLFSQKTDSRISDLVEAANAHPVSFFALRPALAEAGGSLLRILEGHTDEITGVLELTSGRLLSWASAFHSKDTALRLWNPKGELLEILKGHTDQVRGALELADGRVLSWASDKALRLWSADGILQAVLVGHTDEVDGVLELIDRRLLTWAKNDKGRLSKDSTLRLWTAEGASLAVLGGHTAISDRIRATMYKIPVLQKEYRFLEKVLWLWKLVSEFLHLVESHTDAISGAREMADGRLLSWSDDHTLRLWDAKGKPLRVLRGHTSYIRGALELTDGRLVSWAWDRTIRLWSRKGKKLRVVKATGPSAYIEGMLELTDGRLLSWFLSHEDDDKTLLLWSGEGKPLGVLVGHGSGINGAIELANERLLSWSSDKTLRLWSREGELLRVLEGHTASVSGALELSDGSLLSWSGSILRLWSGEGEPLCILEGHTLAIKGAMELADGRLLSWSWDRTLRLWDAKKQTKSMQNVLGSSVKYVRSLTSGLLLSWASNRTLRLWSGEGELLRVLEGHTNWVAGARELADGRLLSWASDRTLRLWSGDGELLRVLEGHTNWVAGALELADGRLLSWSNDHTLRMWSREGEPIRVLEDHTHVVNGALELADRRLLSWSEDRTLRLWSREGEPVRVLNGHTDTVRGALQLADGRLLSWASTFSTTLRLWSSEGNSLQILSGHTNWVNGAMELVDGRLLSWSYDKTLRLWDSNGESLKSLNGHTDSVGRALQLEDGRLLSWARSPAFTSDFTIWLWSADGEPLNVLSNHTDEIFGVRLLVDGRFLSWSRDKTLRLWNAEGKLQMTFSADAPINCCTLIPNSNRCTIGDSEGRVIVLEYPPAH